MGLVELTLFDLMHINNREHIFIDPRLITGMRISHIQHFTIMKNSKVGISASYCVLTVDGKEIAVRQSLGMVCYLVAQACQSNIVDSLGIKLDGALLDMDIHIANPAGVDAMDARNDVGICGTERKYKRYKGFESAPWIDNAPLTY
jgi:hypothetical protein